VISLRVDRLNNATVLRGPIPALVIHTVPRITVDGQQNTKQPPSLIHQRVTASILGVSIPDASRESVWPFGQPVTFFGNQEANWQLRLPRYILDAIESVRQHDVTVVLNVEIGVWTQPTQANYSPFEWTNAQYIEEIPQSRWLPLLDELGYGGGWLIEISKPSIKGLEDAIKFLDEAQKSLGERNPKAALLSCRQAWDQIDSILDPLGTGVAAAINGLSKGESGQPSKADRVIAIQAAVDKFDQIGPHSDSYEITLDDALLGYRLTVEAISYLSKRIVEAETAKLPRKRSG
jgi:hypothetical protein